MRTSTATSGSFTSANDRSPRSSGFHRLPQGNDVRHPLRKRREPKQPHDSCPAGVQAPPLIRTEAAEVVEPTRRSGYRLPQSASTRLELLKGTSAACHAEPADVHSDPAPHSHLMTTRRTSSAPVKTVSAVAVWLPRGPRPQPGPPRPQPRPLATYARPSSPAHRSLDLSRAVLPIHAEA